MQIFVRARMKILSKSKVAQVFLFFLYPPPPTHQQQHPGLTPSAYWRFDFFHIFFPPSEVTQACGVKDGERYVCHEAREHVSPRSANSSSNTRARGWTRARLAPGTSKQHPHSRGEQPRFPDVCYAPALVDNNSFFSFHIPALFCGAVQ